MPTLAWALLTFVPHQDLAALLEKADGLLQEAKAAYEEGRAKSSVQAFIDAGFKLEATKIKYLVLQEIGPPELQKTAGERLRAVNQLAKLINDGKIAITSGPKAEAPTAPESPPPAVPPPPAPPVDVARRAPVPDAATQGDAEKLLRDVYKDQYAKKATADRRRFAALLLEESQKSRGDLAAFWVICREAQAVALEAGDIDLALRAVDAASEVFDVDLLSMRGEALADAGRSAKAPEDAGALAQALLAHADALVEADQYDAADKAAAAAIQHARKAGDAQFTAYVGRRAKETSEAKSLFQAEKRSLEALARDPENPQANLQRGRFLCFVKGAWDVGLLFLVKGSDAALKGLAEKELAPASDPSGRVALADGWYGLAEKERSFLLKSRLMAHAKTIYESALPDAPPLQKAILEKRLDAIGRQSPPGPPLNLLPLIDPARDAVAGMWSCDGRSLASEAPTKFARIQVPYEPPEEYDLTVVVERRGGTSGFLVGLISGGSSFCIALDSYGGTVSGISNVDGKTTRENGTAGPGRLLATGRAVTVICAVRKEGVTATVGGRKVTSFTGASGRLSMPEGFFMPQPRQLWIATMECTVVVRRLTLTTVTGQGRPGR